MDCGASAGIPGAARGWAKGPPSLAFVENQWSYTTRPLADHPAILHRVNVK